MPGPDATLVKCEPASDDDSDSQYSHSFLYKQLPSLERPVKIEVSHDDTGTTHLLHNLQNSDGLEELAPLAPAGPAATPVVVKQEPESIATTLETLESSSHSNVMSSVLLEKGMGLLRSHELIESEFLPLLAVKDEPMSEGEQLQLSGEDTSDSSSTLPEPSARGSPKSWTPQDMENALEALRKHNMSLTKASAKFGIPSTTLWQRAHRLGIDTPKKEGANKSWSQADLHGALHALRAGAISANKASKAYGIPSSTLYKIARREGIRLAAPFNAAPTAWRRADLDRALASIRCGASSVQRAASQFGIPTGTLYGRCKREGIELSRSNPTPWSEDAMGEALEAVRVGQMSINQAAIHYNLPYSSLYGRFKRCKYQTQIPHAQHQNQQETYEPEHNQSQEMSYYQQTESQGTAEQNSHIAYIHHVRPESHLSPADYGHNMYYGCNNVITS